MTLDGMREKTALGGKQELINESRTLVRQVQWAARDYWSGSFYFVEIRNPANQPEFSPAFQSHLVRLYLGFLGFLAAQGFLGGPKFKNLARSNLPPYWHVFFFFHLVGRQSSLPIPWVRCPMQANSPAKDPRIPDPKLALADTSDAFDSGASVLRTTCHLHI